MKEEPKDIIIKREPIDFEQGIYIDIIIYQDSNKCSNLNKTLTTGGGYRRFLTLSLSFFLVKWVSKLLFLALSFAKGKIIRSQERFIRASWYLHVCNNKTCKILQIGKMCLIFRLHLYLWITNFL